MPDFVTTQDILDSINNKPKLPMQKLGMPGPAHVMGLAKNIAQGVPPYLSDIYERMKRAVTQGPYSSPSGSYDPSIGTLPFEIMSPGYGRAAVGALESGLGAGGFKSSVGMRGVGGPRTPWTPEMQNRLKALNETFKDTPGRQKLIIKNFREMHPDYEGSDNTILTMSQRLKNWGTLNKTPGTELGAFGGQGRLNTPSYGESMGWLQDQKPVDRQWVENWAKDAGVPIKDINVTKRKGQESTTYIKMLDNSGKQVTVRVPNDPLGHIGYPQKGKEGSFFDTGREVVKYPTLEPMDEISPNKQLFSREGKTGGVLSPNYTPYESNLVNESGMPYANREAMDAALKWRLSKAPFGGNWLVPEDMAPRIPSKITPQPNISNIPDPNQLKLLSQGFTPADILKVLQQNGQPQ